MKDETMFFNEHAAAYDATDDGVYDEDDDLVCGDCGEAIEDRFYCDSCGKALCAHHALGVDDGEGVVCQECYDEGGYDEQEEDDAPEPDMSGNWAKSVLDGEVGE